MGFFSAFKKFFGGKTEPAPTPEQPEIETPDKEQEDALISTPEAADFQPPEDLKKKVNDDVASLTDEASPASDATKFDADAIARDSGQKGAALAQAKPEMQTQEAPANASASKTAPEENAVALQSDSIAPAPHFPANEDTGKPADAPASGQTPEEDELLVRLRAAEPKLSAWLGIVLDGQEQADARLWKRLRFFLQSLEAPEAEIDSFISDFQNWLETMEYVYVDEFRSELQYKLALALELEDEEDERNRLALKLSKSLAATRAQLGRGLDALFASHGELIEAFWEDLEELFIMSDLGYEASLEIVRRLKRRASDQHLTTASDARALLADELEEIFRQPTKIRSANKPEIILMMGVNGAGKTTTIAKLAHRARMEGKKTLVAAADTFRAAAIEQLEVWAKRAGAEFYSRPPGSDPAAVAWEALDYAQKNDIDIVFVDTAGRLQTRVNLMEELGKIRQVVAKKQPGAPHRSMLVLDATTGQNALSQAKLFREAAGADEIVLTKLDGTSKGGIAIAVAMQEGLPITYIGLGEKMDDLRPFNGRDFAAALLENTANE